MRAASSQRGTLGTRTFVALAIIAIAIPTLGGAWAVVHVQRSLTNTVEESALTTARTLSLQIEQGYSFAVDLARSAAHRPGLVLWVASRDRARQMEVLRNTVETADVLASISVYDRRHRLLASFPRPPRAAAAVGEMTPRIFPAEPSDDDAYVVVREPISRDRGGAIGYLIAEISLARVAPLHDLRIGRTGAASLVDLRGQTLVTGEPRRIGTTLQAPAVRALLAERSGTALYYSPVLRRHEIAALSRTEDPPWAVVVSQAQSEIYAPVRDLRNGLLIGLAALIALGLTLTVFAARRMSGYERQLVARLDEEQRLNRALDEFAGRVAHDLRNPMAAILGGAQLAARDPNLSGHSQEALQIVERQVRKGMTLVDDLLGLARASSTPSREPIDVARIATEVGADIFGVDLTVEHAPAPVVADPVGVRQMLMNLLQNAANYACVDGRAEVTLGYAEEDGGWRISVADRGPGVPERDAAHIFRAFARGGSPNRAGTGLGLTIVATVAEAHGGRAWYEPREGGGSVFSIFLPEPENA